MLVVQALVVMLFVCVRSFIGCVVSFVPQLHVKANAHSLQKQQPGSRVAKQIHHRHSKE